MYYKTKYITSRYTILFFIFIYVIYDEQVKYLIYLHINTTIINGQVIHELFEHNATFV